jgi:hypothetical protein
MIDGETDGKSSKMKARFGHPETQIMEKRSRDKHERPVG